MTKPSLRKGTLHDWDFLSAVHEACMREYGEKTWGVWLPEPYDHFRPEIHEIIQYEGAEIGCMALIDEPDALLLEKLYILPSHQRMGIGTALLKRLIAQAHADRKPIRLRVLRVNPARQLYERNGFTIDRSTEERHFMSYTASVADAADQRQ